VAGGIALLLCCGGASVGGFALYRVATGPQRAVEAFLDDLQAERYGQAYERLCSTERARTSSENFADGFDEPEEKLRDYEVTGSRTESTNGRTTGEVDVRLTFGTASATSGTLELVREDDEWKVCDAVGFD